MESARHIENLGVAADTGSDEERGESQVLRSLAALSQGLERSGVKYCVLHGWQTSDIAQGDFDLAIEPERVKTLEHILEHDCGTRVVQLLQHETTGFFFVAQCEGYASLALVDAATDYRRDGRIYMSSAEMLRGTQTRDGLRAAGAGTEFKYLLIKKISKLSIPTHQRDRLQELNVTLGAEAGKIANELFGRHDGERVHEWINARRWGDLDADLPGLRQLLRHEVLRRDPLNWLRYWLPELGRRWQRWRNPTGLFVAVLGPDGAGKSTLIDNLLTRLSGAFRKTDSFHLRPAVFGARPEGPPVTDPHGLAPRSPGSSVAKIAYYVAEYALGYALKLRPALTRTTLILSDRYFDDLLIDPRRYRYGGPQWLVRRARLFVPQPDLWLILDVPEKSLLERKREVSDEELSRQRRAYRELWATLPNAFILDGSVTADRVGTAAAEVCLDHLHSRYRARRAMWFRSAAQDDLDWLASIIFRPAKAQFEVGRNQPPAPRDSREFMLLRLRDGRGFLLPSEERSLRAALGLYNAHSVKGRAAKSVLNLLARMRLTRFVLPRVSVSEEQVVAPTDRHPNVLDRIGAIMGNPALKFAVSLGTPGPHRKPVVQIFTDNGRIIGYAKVGANAETDHLVRNEAATLTRLNALKDLPFTVPRLIAANESGDNYLCIQSAEEGQSRTVSNSFGKEFFAALIGLSRIDFKQTTLGASRFWTDLKRKIERVRHPYYRQICERASCWLTTHCIAQPLGFHASHGDFAPWNARLVGGRLYLFDWEYADRERPAGWDLFHFLIQTSALLKGYSALRILRDFDESREFGRWAAQYADHLNIARNSLRPLLLLYLLRQLAIQAGVRGTDLQQMRRLATLSALLLSKLEAGL